MPSAPDSRPNATAPGEGRPTRPGRQLRNQAVARRNDHCPCIPRPGGGGQPPPHLGAIDALDVDTEFRLHREFLCVAVQVPDEVVAGDPPSELQGNSPAGQPGKPTNRVQMQQVVPSLPTRPDGRRPLQNRTGQATLTQGRGHRQSGRAGPDHDNVCPTIARLYGDSAAVTIAAMAPGRSGPTSEGAGDRWTWAQCCARRAERHRLIVPAQSEPAEVASVLGAIHAQVMSAAELSIGLRLQEARKTHVQQALWDDRRLVKSYGPRGTVHLFAAGDLPMWTGALAAIRQRYQPFGGRTDGRADRRGGRRSRRCPGRGRRADRRGTRGGRAGRNRRLGGGSGGSGFCRDVAAVAPCGVDRVQ